MLRELLEQIRGPARDREEQEAEEVEEGQGGVDAHVGAGAADFLDAEGFVLGAEAGGEDQEGFVGGAEVAGEEVGEGGAGGVEGGGVRVVLGVPFVLEFGELFGRVFGAEGEVLFRFVRLMFCSPKRSPPHPGGNLAEIFFFETYLQQTTSPPRDATPDPHSDTPQTEYSSPP